MSDYPLFAGDKEGAAVWFKIAACNDSRVQAFVQRANEIGQERGRFFFTDVEEQLKAKLNNQSWYIANWDVTRRQWIIDPIVRIAKSTSENV